MEIYTKSSQVMEKAFWGRAPCDGLRCLGNQSVSNVAKRRIFGILRDRYWSKVLGKSC